MTTHITASDVSAIVTHMRLPAIQIFPGDWMRDNVAGCSPVAQALWLREMFVMHDAKPYGHLIENGSPMRVETLIRRCGFKLAETKKASEELQISGVPRVTGTDEYRELLRATIHTDEGAVTVDLSPLGVSVDGVIYSKRMVKDQRLRVIRKLAGKLGGNPYLVNQPDNQLSASSRARPHEEDENEYKKGSPVDSNNDAPKAQSPVDLILGAFTEDLRPHKGIVARWIEQIAEARRNPDLMAAAEIVREFIWKNPTKNAEYIGQCVGTAAKQILAGVFQVPRFRGPELVRPDAARVADLKAKFPTKSLAEVLNGRK